MLALVNFALFCGKGVQLINSFGCFQPMGSRKDLSCQGVRGLVNWKFQYDISGLLTFQTNSVRNQNITLKKCIQAV